LRDLAAFDRDQSKSQLCCSQLFSVGYRYLPTPGHHRQTGLSHTLSFASPYVGRSYCRTGTVPISTGRAATSLGTIAIALMSKGLDDSQLSRVAEACWFRPVLRAPEQYRQATQSAIEFAVRSSLFPFR
jgi:hypothetical protein